MSTVPVDEQISAWLDDELPADELELLAARLTADSSRHAKAARYALIGTLVRGVGRESLPSLELAARVRAALDADSGPRSERPPALVRRSIPRPAIAAALALVAVGLFQILRPVAPPAGQVATQVPFPAAVVTHPGLHTPERLTSYLVYHGEFAGPLPTKVVDSNIVNQRPYMIKVNAVERLSND